MLQIECSGREGGGWTGKVESEYTEWKYWLNRSAILEGVLATHEPQDITEGNLGLPERERIYLKILESFLERKLWIICSSKSTRASHFWPCRCTSLTQALRNSKETNSRASGRTGIACINEERWKKKKKNPKKIGEIRLFDQLWSNSFARD